MKKITSLLVPLLLVTAKASYAQLPTERLTFPFSEYVIRSDWAMPIVWKYRPFEDIPENETVIAPPAFGQDWNSWYKKMKEYQAFLRANLNDTASLYLQMKVSKGKSVRLHYKRVLNDMRLRPGDNIIFDGAAKNDHGATRFRISLMYIRIGEEKSHAVVKLETVDTIAVTSSWTSLHQQFRLPAFDTATLMIQPVVFFESDNATPAEIQIKSLRFSIPVSQRNKQVYEALKPSFYPASPAVDKQLYHREEMQWIKTNFISGFAFLWDQDLWDADRKVFTVEKYCNKMKKEFGGFQSVLFWYSYPNLGIDQRNTWEFLDDIPGGRTALKNMVKAFHDQGVRVYFPYTSWEIDTRRTDQLTDPQHWSKVIAATDADGLFFDVFFDAGDFQQELDKVKKGISIGTEHHPSLQNIQGYNGLTSSWGQTIQPYHNNGVSRAKWLIPEHMQWTINRTETSRQNSLAYSWINGQGILVWENVFGYMNTWNAQDRKDLRKINAIYQQFAGLYTSDTWKPYLPYPHPEVHLSSWENGESILYNIVTDGAGAVQQVEVPANDETMQYYDLWNGRPLAVTHHTVTVPVSRLGCVLATRKQPSPALAALLLKQKRETLAPLPANDAHTRLISSVFAKPAPEVIPSAANIHSKLLPVKAGEYHLVTKHLRREGGCFPDAGAQNNNDYTTERNAYGKELIVHHTKVTTAPFGIMPRAVTNGEFEAFIKSTGYRPQDTVNYLRHWHGSSCPDSLLQEAVVYVSLADARAYARWAGMRLPTEWEWQIAGETMGERFIFNEVWEWNESERFDGHNHFIALRGGCANWKLKTSDWYFPGTPGTDKPGGRQPLDSHCKYYMMMAGFDRAGTIGFRCMKPGTQP